MHEKLAVTVTIDCRTTESCKFKLWFHLHGVINIKEQTLESIKDVVEGENIQTEDRVLGYKIDLYFRDYKLAIEIDELSHKDRKIERQK